MANNTGRLNKERYMLECGLRELKCYFAQEAINKLFLKYKKLFIYIKTYYDMKHRHPE